VRASSIRCHHLAIRSIRHSARAHARTRAHTHARALWRTSGGVNSGDVLSPCSRNAIKSSRLAKSIEGHPPPLANGIRGVATRRERRRRRAPLYRSCSFIARSQQSALSGRAAPSHLLTLRLAPHGPRSYRCSSISFPREGGKARERERERERERKERPSSLARGGPAL